MATQPNDPTAAGNKIATSGSTPSPSDSAAYQKWLAAHPEFNTTSGQVYIGVDAGSDLEKYGLQGPGYGQPGAALGAKYGGPFKSYYGHRKPLYKVGYQNSKTFARELNNMDANAIYLYQRRLNSVGMLDTFTPGKLDKATRGAFKELLSTANQSAVTWQQTLQEIEQSGGKVSTSTQTHQPFVAQLDDPATLRATFQQVAQTIYGGDLPDAEINSMIDAYRNQQLTKQQTAYNIAETGGTVDTETNPSAFAQQEIQSTHPDQAARVKFQDTLGTILKTFSSQAPG